jgi:hypothetical protein
MTEAPGGPFQAGPRHAKTGIAYSSTLASLTDPGRGEPFFRHRPQSLEALAAEMARLAYRDFGPGGRVLSQTLSSIDFVLESAPFDDGNTQAFLAGSAHLRVLSIRGSDDLRAWQTNARTRPVSWEGPGLVHEGFAEAWRKAHETWAPVLAAGKESGRPLLVTGHSLGGALATLTAAHLPHSLLYSFGAPRVGNRAFAYALDRHAGRRPRLAPDTPTRAAAGHGRAHGPGQTRVSGPEPGATQRPDRPRPAKLRLGVEVMEGRCGSLRRFRHRDVVGLLAEELHQANDAHDEDITADPEDHDRKRRVQIQYKTEL